MTNPCRLRFKPRIISAVIEKVLGLDRLAQIYDGRPPGCTAHEFLQHTLDALGVSLDLVNASNLEEIPRTGPVLIVANHPLGGLEGVAIAKVISDVRPDLKVLTNELLRSVPELADIFIGVDILSSDAAAGNVSSIKQVHKHLKNGGAVLIFPAGMVSTYEHGHRRIQDRAWNRLAGQLLKRYQATCLPVHVGGTNSWLFYAAGMIHPRLRTAMLPRQLANKQGFKLELRFGRPIPAAELRLLQSPRAITDYLRVSTDALVREPETLPGMTHQLVVDSSPASGRVELFAAITGPGRISTDRT